MFFKSPRTAQDIELAAQDLARGILRSHCTEVEQVFLGPYTLNPAPDEPRGHLCVITRVRPDDEEAAEVSHQQLIDLEVLLSEGQGTWKEIHRFCSRQWRSAAHRWIIAYNIPETIRSYQRNMPHVAQLLSESLATRRQYNPIEGTFVYHEPEQEASPHVEVTLEKTRRPLDFTLISDPRQERRRPHPLPDQSRHTSPSPARPRYGLRLLQ